MGGSRIVEMSWVCRQCETRNQGRDKVCVACGDPKDPSEKFEMPGQTERAPSVSDPELLRRATAGQDWTCDRCGANVGALHAVCTGCGAARPGATPPTAVRAARAPMPRGPARRSGMIVFVVLALGMIGLPVLMCSGLASWRSRPVELAATVERAHWERTVEVERYALRERQGFAESRPTDALEVRSLGRRHHHDDRVLDHHETVRFTERVQNGTEKEAYTVREKCGETCVDQPERCHEVCTPNDNGFASCHDVCSGGGRSCTPDWCTETRYRDVPRYEQVERTRQEPVYREVPVDAEYFAWKHREWAHERTVTETGDGTEPRWPSDEKVALRAGLAPGEDEREKRQEHFEVALRSADGRVVPVEVTAADELARYPLASLHTVRLVRDEVVAIDPPSP